MKNRRIFLRAMSRFFITIPVLWSPFLLSVKKLAAKTKKFLVPKGIDLNELIDKNPADLITKKLEITPVEKFETMGQTEHKVDIDKWRLEIAGQIQAPVNFSYKELLKFESITKKALLICPGFFALHGNWKGLEMNSFLSRIKIKSHATHVRFTGPKGPGSNSEIFPIEDLKSNKVFLAYDVNSRPLAVKHGYPLRIVADGYFGGSWIKYVDDIKAEDLSDGKKFFQFKDR